LKTNVVKNNDIECVPVGIANGVAGDFPLSAEQKEQMIEEAAEHLVTSLMH
jgi:hypothetical protein